MSNSSWVKEDTKRINRHKTTNSLSRGNKTNYKLLMARLNAVKDLKSNINLSGFG